MLLDHIDGTYQAHYLPSSCGGGGGGDATFTISHQGNTLTLVDGYHNIHTGPLNADGSFTATDARHPITQRGVFATEGGHTVIRDGEARNTEAGCSEAWTATKQ